MSRIYNTVFIGILLSQTSQNVGPEAAAFVVLGVLCQGLFSAMVTLNSD